MTRKQKWLRFLIGGVVVIAILVISFSLINQWIFTWGSTRAEQQMVYPRDDILPTPLLTWTHGINIHAPVEKVWPWVAQIGEKRGGFYSYTFIENMISGHRTYINTNQILPEYQDPQPGTPIIVGMVNWKEIKTGEWILAEDNIPDLGWTWLWYLQPQGDQTRMLIRMRIQTPPGMQGSEAIKFVLNLGGFLMERNMMEGVRDRAQGFFEPLWTEYAEIAVWLVTLVCGILYAIKFVNRKEWIVPFALAVSSVLILIWFTFGQPVVWLRVVIDLGLLGGVVWLYKK
jgi:hypothetical protein